jgi:hypothetical protein
MRNMTRIALVGAAGLALGAGISIPLAGAASASGSASVQISASGQAIDGGNLTVQGTNFPTHANDPSGVEIIECSDPGGTAANLPTSSAQGCDGTTVSPTQINTSSTGALTATYQVTSLNSSDSNITCDSTDYCVLWVGVDYNTDFIDPATQAFSTPFLVESSGTAPHFTSASSGSMPSWKSTTLTVRATGVDDPTITESGALPGGVTFTNNPFGTATFSGEPTHTGIYPVTLTASNGVSPNATQTFDLDAGFVITTTSLPSSAPGASYHGSVAAVGGTTPYKWKAQGLPKGVKINKSTGALAGTVSTKAHVETYHVTFTVTDKKLKSGKTTVHEKETATKSLSLVIS